MATYTAQQVTSAGLSATARTADDGDEVAPGVILRVINAGDADVTLTLTPNLTVDGDLSVSPRVVIIPDGEARYVKTSQLYAATEGGNVALEWSETDDVTFEVIR